MAETMEHEADDPALGPFEAARQLTPAVEQLSQLGDDWELSALVVLRSVRLQPYKSGNVVDLSPAQRHGLRLPTPAGEVAEPNKVGLITAQVPADRLKLLAIDEARPRVSLGERTDHRYRGHHTMSKTKAVRAPESGQFPIDRRHCGLLGEPQLGVVRDVGACHAGCLDTTEKAQQMSVRVFQSIEAPPGPGLVVRLEGGQEVVDPCQPRIRRRC